MIVSLSSVKSAASGTAWKTAEMRGYVKKTVPDDAARLDPATVTGEW